MGMYIACEVDFGQGYQTVNQYPREYGRYVLLERIGAGGMSHVDLARRAVEDASFVRFNVIKRIAPQNVTDESFIRMFLDEARINAELHHANIAQVYDFGKFLDTDSGTTEFFLVMEYVPGMDLRAVQRAAAARGLGIPLRYSLSVVIEVLRGLQYAHTRHDTLGRPMRIVHRDINPRNVMLSIQGDVKVIDFGVALAADRLEHTQGQNLKGKFAYMAPEQIEGNVTLDGRADIFAVGLMLYELVAGKGPFQRLTELQIMHRILTGRIPLMDVPPQYPRPELLHQIQRRALATDRDQRYPDADAMRVDLERAAAILGGPSSARERALFLTEVEPDRVEAIGARLHSYRARTFPGIDSHTDTSIRAEEPQTTVSGSGTLAGPEPARRRSWVVPVLFLLLGLAVGTIVVVMLRLRPSVSGAQRGDQGAPLVDALGGDGQLAGGAASGFGAAVTEDAASGVQGVDSNSTGPHPPAAEGALPVGAATGASQAEQVAAADPEAIPDRHGAAATRDVGSSSAVSPPAGEVGSGPEAEAGVQVEVEAGTQAEVEVGAEAGAEADAAATTASGLEEPEAAGGTSAGGDSVALATGYLQVASEPRGLEVYLDGAYVGRTPLRGYRLPVGSHAIVIRQGPGREYSTTLEIKALQVGSVTHKFSEGAEGDEPRSRR